MEIDSSLYPDFDIPPSQLESPGERADYLHRVCGAMDFQVFPEPETWELLAGWKEIFDRFPMAASPAYRTMREVFGWEPVEMPAGLPAYRPPYLAMDAAEGREADPCESMI